MSISSRCNSKQFSNGTRAVAAESRRQPLCCLHTSRQAAQEESDGSHDVCVLCGSGGNLLCCDACPATYHVRCVGESNRAMGASEWLCPECRVGGRGEWDRGGYAAEGGCLSTIIWLLWLFWWPTLQRAACCFDPTSHAPSLTIWQLTILCYACHITLQAKLPACASPWRPATAGSSRCTSCTALCAAPRHLR